MMLFSLIDIFIYEGGKDLNYVFTICHFFMINLFF